MEFLVKKRDSTVAHVWNGKDTLCRMFSTGGMRKGKHHVVRNKKDLMLCKMCENSLKKGGQQNH